MCELHIVGWSRMKRDRLHELPIGPFLFVRVVVYLGRHTPAADWPWSSSHNSYWGTVPLAGPVNVATFVVDRL